MAKNPASDYGRDLGKLEGGVDVLKNLTFTVIGFLFAIGGGGIFLLTQIYDLKSSLGETKQNVASALERIGKIENAASTIEGAVAELRGGQVAASDALSRIENSIAAAIGGRSMAALGRLETCFEKNSRQGSETNPFVAPNRKP